MRASRWPAARVLLALTLAAQVSSGQTKCNEASVDLVVELQAPDTTVQQSLERQLAMELRAHGLGVCRATDSDRVVAHVRLYPIAPDLGRVGIAIEIEAARPQRSERTLDVRALPADARAAAIASAADELLRSALEEARSAALRAEPHPEPPPATGAAERSPREPGPMQNVPTERPALELGVAGTASTFFGHRQAGGGDLLGRWWPAPRVALTGGMGGSWAQSKSSALGSVQANDVHGTLNAGYALVPAEDRLGLSAQAGLRLARVRFEVTPLGEAIARPGNSWALVGSAGVEGWARLGALCFSLGVAGIVALMPARATAGSASITSLEGLGAELFASVWIPLGAAAP
jgi:hypothetical protein